MSNKDSTFLPVVTCPNCLDSSCYPIELYMACEKCSNVYPINIKYFNNKVLFNFDNFDIDEYTKQLNIKKEQIDSFASALNSNVELTEDLSKSFSVIFSGKTLDLLRKIKLDNNLPNLMMTIKFMFEGFIYLIKELKNMQGQKVYLIDSYGNKSGDIKKGILKSAYDLFHEEQNKSTVKNFLTEMDIKFDIDDIKKDSRNPENNGV